LPYGIWSESLAARSRGERAVFMVPCGAVPLGTLGYVSAALELAEQVARGELPAPDCVVVATGSNCTTAGLLLGFAIAARRGVAFARGGVPRLVSVRVTPWPVSTSRRIVSLARRSSQLLQAIAGDARLHFTRQELCHALEIDSSQLGRGYGHATRAGLEAIELWQRHGNHRLEPCYSAKAAAAVIARLRSGASGTVLYWATKSSATIPTLGSNLGPAPPRPMAQWLTKTGQPAY
jgi:D-cysteine desulfhydrase